MVKELLSVIESGMVARDVLEEHEKQKGAIPNSEKNRETRKNG